MEIKYMYCGHIQTDINHIKCEPEELDDALQKLQTNLSQAAQIILEIGKHTIYIYHNRFNGYKRATKKKFANNEYEAAMVYACGGAKKVQFYTKLKPQIEKIINSK
jgi:hypothetical protein